MGSIFQCYNYQASTFLDAPNTPSNREFLMFCRETRKLTKFFHFIYREAAKKWPCCCCCCCIGLELSATIKPLPGSPFQWHCVQKTRLSLSFALFLLACAPFLIHTLETQSAWTRSFRPTTGSLEESLDIFFFQWHAHSHDWPLVFPSNALKE